MSSPVKHYGRWRIRWIDAEGKRCSEVYIKHRDAELALQRHEVEAEEIRRGLRPRPLERHTYGELADYWLEHRAPEKRSEKDDQSIIRKHLRPAFGTLLVSDVSVPKIDGFRQALECGVKTEHNILTLLISTLRLAKELKWLAELPAIKKPKLDDIAKNYRYLKTEDEIRRFLTAAYRVDERLFVLYATALYTGMRAGELAALRWPSVDLGRRLIDVKFSFTNATKGGYVRYAPIVDALLPLLERWRARNPNDLVFPSQAGTMLQPSARVYQENLHDVLAAAGLAPLKLEDREVPFITFHGLRHTWASHWMMNDGSIFKLQKIGGWKSFAMVQRYAHLSPSAFAEDYQRFGAPVNVGADRNLS